MTNTLLDLPPGAPHPRAVVQSLDLAAGSLVFAWADSAGMPVDSGGSIARFTPLIINDVAVEPDEAVLVAAVAATYAPQAAPVPAEVTPLQMRRALNAAGLRPAVESAVAAAPQDARDAWEFASVIRRDDPVLAAVGAALGKTAAEIDDLFRAAASF